MKISVLTTPGPCMRAWETAWGARGLFDLWPVRDSFNQAFHRPLHFILATEGTGVVGFLPLCWDEDAGQYVMFPGEVWQGKTWIEQNRVISSSPEVFERMIEEVPGPLHLRYLLPPKNISCAGMHVDETGYLFYPGLCDYSFENYRLSFSGKTWKKIRADLRRFSDHDVRFRFDHREDIEALFQLNLSSFGRMSYFSDPRFVVAFNNLVDYLSRSGMLRITTVEIQGQVAAVDLGACFRNTYTLLAGGTHPGFPGVAKLINLHHIERSCRERFDQVDFLCGDFNWKSRFHLIPRPLYQLSRNIVSAYAEAHRAEAVA